jgi:hypothetical protein
MNQGATVGGEERSGVRRNMDDQQAGGDQMREENSDRKDCALALIY